MEACLKLVSGIWVYGTGQSTCCHCY